MNKCSIPGCPNTAVKDHMHCTPCKQRSDRAWERTCEESQVELLIDEGDLENALRGLLTMVKELRK